jgi:drug/metabolite transporter (DMT)-like permease
MIVLAVALALLAAACYAVGAALQHQQAAATRPGRGADPRLLWRLVRRPRWVLGVLANTAGTGLHAVALSMAPLALVQPIGVLTIAFAVPVNAALRRRRPGRGEVVGAVVTATGLALLAVATRASEEVPVLGLADLLPVLGVLVVVLGAALLAARRLTGAARTIVLAIGAGTGFGVTSALVRPVIHLIGNAVHAGTAGLVTAAVATTVTGCAAAVTALLLEQTAFQSGQLGLAVAVVTVADPVSALTTGGLLLGQPVELRPLAAVVAGLAVLTGVVLLSRHRPTAITTAVRITTDPAATDLATTARAGSGGGEVSGVTALRDRSPRSRATTGSPGLHRRPRRTPVPPRPRPAAGTPASGPRCEPPRRAAAG